MTKQGSTIENSKKRKTPDKARLKFGSKEENDLEMEDITDESSRKKKMTRKYKKSVVVDKSNKGLRHFSLKVCQKVEERQKTSYNEVADDLVKECLSQRPESADDEKNIRRRVYDALNVLMALDVISKDKKEIQWRGLPTNKAKEVEQLMKQSIELQASVERKREQLQEMLLQQIAFKKLIEKNKKRSFEVARDENSRLDLPFIVVNTDHDTVIQCEMSEDRQDVFFNFSAPFEINDDNEILRRLKLHIASKDELNELVPSNLLPYLPETYLNEGGGITNIVQHPV